MLRIAIVGGTRPNFVKIAPLMRAFAARGVQLFFIHTGQHYDEALSEVFLKEFALPTPDLFLGIGSGERLPQTEKVISALVPVLHKEKIDLLVVVGDVLSTAAATVAGVVAGVRVAHVEAGLRSGDLGMPEEVNRIIADHHASLLFATEDAAITNLASEGISSDRVRLVGNVLVDAMSIPSSSAMVRLPSSPYCVLTLHRQATVDDKERMTTLMETLATVASRVPLVWPMHPRTRARLETFGLSIPSGIDLREPMGYHDMHALLRGSLGVLTDSGGLQDETTILGIPCITLRENTERPVTVSEGTSEIVGFSPEKILDAVDRLLAGQWKKGSVPTLWDGHAAERIVDILLSESV